MTNERVQFDLVVRSEIEIVVPPAVVWEGLQRVREWKPSVVSIERIEGRTGEVGETLRVGQRPGDETVYTIMRTLRLKHCEWKVESLLTEDGRIPVGYVIHSLYPEGSYTRLVYDFVCRCRLEQDEMLGSLEAMSRAIQDGTQRKVETDLRALKSLLERG